MFVLSQQMMARTTWEYIQVLAMLVVLLPAFLWLLSWMGDDILAPKTTTVRTLL